MLIVLLSFNSCQNNDPDIDYGNPLEGVLMNYEHLPYDLEFCFRFNLHKLAGFLIDDYDIEKLSRMYIVPEKELRGIHDNLESRIAGAAEQLKSRLSYSGPVDSLTWLALGDSITSDRMSYAKLIRSVWKGENDRRVLDAGISGDTTSDLINRYYGTALELDFDMASIFIGTNDARGHNDRYEISNTSIPEFRRNYDYLTKTLREKVPEVITITIPMVNDERFSAFFKEENNYLYRAETIHEINTVIRDISAKHKTILVDFADEIESSEIDVLDKDGLHLSLLGHELLAGLLLEVLD